MQKLPQVCPNRTFGSFTTIFQVFRAVAKSGNAAKKCGLGKPVDCKFCIIDVFGGLVILPFQLSVSVSQAIPSCAPGTPRAVAP
jgi:hypothetical protein